MKIRRLVPLLAAGLLLAASTARAAPWEVAKGSEVRFKAKITGSSFVAETDAVSGTIDYDSKSGAIGGGTISVKADSFKTGVSMRDTHMRNKYLEAEKYPAITFALKPATIPALAGEGGTIEGTFTVKEKSKPVKLAVKVTSARRDRVEATTFFKLDITDYGIPQPGFAVVKMKTVIDVTIELVLTPKG